MISVQLESLFVVQGEKLEELSQGYGMLLDVFGLRTKEKRAQYSAHIKEKVSLK